MKRIFDDPTHPQYGPVRRLWVVLVQLDLLEAAERWSKHQEVNWDHAVAHVIARFPDQKESGPMCDLIGQLMRGWQ